MASGNAGAVAHVFYVSSEEEETMSYQDDPEEFKEELMGKSGLKGWNRVVIGVAKHIAKWGKIQELIEAKIFNISWGWEFKKFNNNINIYWDSYWL